MMRTRTPHRYTVDPLRHGSALQSLWQLSTTLAGLVVILIFASLFALAPAAPAHAQAVTIFYVDATNGNDSNDGTAWNKAFANLQTAISATTSITGNAQIWVAAGTYYPDQGGSQTDDDRQAVFALRNKVAIYGGFAGGETALSERDPATNVTILSGDLQQNDTPNFGNNADNAYHVVISDGNDQTAILDGFTITGGNANGSSTNARAGGIYILEDSTARFANLIITGNTASSTGGGVYNQSSEPHFTNVTITANRTAGVGGGLVNASSSGSFVQTIISNNRADGSGGGMFNIDSSPMFTNTKILSNTAEDGGGVYTVFDSPTFVQATIAGNVAAESGGGIYENTAFSRYTNVLVSGNVAGERGGGIRASSSGTKLTNVTIVGNRANIDGGGLFTDFFAFDSPILTNTIIWGNSNSQLVGLPDITYSLVQGDDPDGTGNLPGTTNPLFINPIAATSAPTTTGNYRLQLDSPAIDVGNNADNATPVDLDGKPRVSNGTIDLGAYEIGIIYVDQQASGAATGVSWTDAFTNVQDALITATLGSEIWVAKGTYYPNVGGTTPTLTRTATFSLPDGVAMYGGFAGNEIERSERDVITNSTTLSGEIQQDATPENNVYHVVTSANNPATTRLDGFIITGGYADGDENDEDASGGGILVQASSQARFANLTIMGNSATRGGGISSLIASPVLSNSSIMSNTATGDGGGVYAISGTLTLSTTTIVSNTATANGGGIYSQGNELILTDSILNSNTARTGGGAYHTTLNATLTNVTIAGNRTVGKLGQTSGGGLYNTNSTVRLTNVALHGNAAGTRGGGMFNSTAAISATNVTIAGNAAFVSGGGVFNTNSDPAFTNSIIWGNGVNVTNVSDSVPVYAYSFLQNLNLGGTNIPGGNPPAFAGALGTGNAPTTLGSYRLLLESPLINVGFNDVNTTTTDLDGNPRIFNGVIDLGAYETQDVQPEIPPTLTPTPSNTPTVTPTATATPSGTLTATPTELTATPTATDVPTTGTLGGRVWFDSNLNGRQDSGELGLEGIQVELMQAGADGIFGTADDVVVGETVTGVNGIYSFPSRAPGLYQIRVGLSEGFRFTIQSGDPLGSAISPTTGRTDPITLNAGDDLNAISAGFVPDEFPTPTPTETPTNTPTAIPTPTETPTNTPTATLLAGTVELSVTLQGATQVAPGARQTFTVQVTNSGTTNTTTPVTITVQVPISTTFNAANSNPNWRELTPATPEQGAIYGLVLDPPLGTGQTVPFSFTVDVSASVPEGTLLNVPATLNWTDASGQAQTSATRTDVQVVFFRTYLPLVVRANIPPADAFPDLVGTIRLIPSKTRFEPSEPVLIEVVVTNQGEAPTNAGFWVDLYINPAKPPQQNDLWATICGLFPCQGVSWGVSNTLEIGQSIILTSTLASYQQVHTIWQGSFITGTTDLYVYVDVWDPDTTVGAVFEGEAGEQNNVTRLSGLSVPGLRLMRRDEELPMVPPRPAIPLQR